MKKSRHRVHIACRWIFIAALAGGGCQRATPPYETASADHSGTIELLLDSACVLNVDLFAGLSVREFYQRRDYSLAWSDDQGMSAAGNTMIYLVHSAHYYGLLPADYHLHEIGTLSQPYDAVARSQLDVLLTDSFFTMHYHLRYGRLDARFKRIIQLMGIDSAGVAALERGLTDNSIQEQLERQEPENAGYQRLKNALRELIDTTKINIMAPRLEYVSALTPETVLLSINMERWRWENTFPNRFVWINIPSFLLEVVEQDTVVLTSPVIVGAPDTPTPTITSRIACFTIYPYWTVPRKISTEEILPKIKKDTSYLERHHYDVMNKYYQLLDATVIDWSLYNEHNFPFVLRQREGADNTLGVIKFVFDNPYGVYLHDTNARGLFRHQWRALSHGCIRMQKARDLAYYLTKDDDRYSPDDLDIYFLHSRRREIDIKKPIPLYVRYFTAEVRNDHVWFFSDIYKRDEFLIAAIYQVSDAGFSPSTDQSLVIR